jgi:uncharacterized protein YjiS (DUF1127 family)
MSHHHHDRFAPRSGDEAPELLGALRRWWRERRTAAALHGLDDAGLKDLGIHRCQIPSIARRRQLDCGSR